MNNSELSAEIARRLPKFSRRDIGDVLDVLTELCYAELRKYDGEIHLTGIGKLYTETHLVKVGGVMRAVLRKKHGKFAPETLLRQTVRFRAADALRAELNKNESFEQEYHDE